MEINLFSRPALSSAELKVTKNMINRLQVFARRLPVVFCLCNANLMLIYFRQNRNYKLLVSINLTKKKLIFELIVPKVICQTLLLF